MPERDASVLQLTERVAALGDPPITRLMAQALEVPGLLSLAAGFVDLETLPVENVAAALQALLADPGAGRTALQYGTTQGDPELRERLSALLGETARRRGGAERLVVTGGSQQLLYLLAECLVEPGDIVLVERPSYFVYVGALESFRARLAGVACDHEGVVPQDLDRALCALEERGELARVKMIYLMTYAQNPMGTTLSVSRRHEVAAVLRRWRGRGLRALILEDAAYRRVRFEDEPDPPPLADLLPEDDPVCYTESFSKVLSPGLRLGFGILPHELVQPVLRLKSHHDFGTSNFVQRLVTHLLRGDGFESHTAILRRQYLQRYRLLRGELESQLGDRLDLVTPRGGLYLWATLRSGLDTGVGGALFAAALRHKVIYVPGELCCARGEADDRNRASMRLCYAYPPRTDLVEAARRLSRAVLELEPSQVAAPTS